MSNKRACQRQLGGPGPPSPQAFVAPRSTFRPPALSSTVTPGAGETDEGKLSHVAGFHRGQGVGGQQQSQQQQQQYVHRMDELGLPAAATATAAAAAAAAAANVFVPPGLQGGLMAPGAGGYYPYRGFSPMYPLGGVDRKSPGPVSLDRAVPLAQVQPSPAAAAATGGGGSLCGPLQQLAASGGAAAGPIDSASWASLYSTSRAGAGGGFWPAPQVASASTSSPPPLPTATAAGATALAATTATATQRKPSPQSVPVLSREDRQKLSALPAAVVSSPPGAAASNENGPKDIKTAPSSTVDTGGADADGPDDTAEFELDSAGKRRRLTAEERLQRSRERNQLHARKTRQRKKAQLQLLMTPEDSQSEGDGRHKSGNKASRDHPPALAAMSGGTPRPLAGMLRGNVESDDAGDGSSKGSSGGNRSDDLGSESTAGTSCSASSSGRTSSEANSSDGAAGAKNGGGSKGADEKARQQEQQQQRKPRVGNPGDTERLLELSKKTRSECTPEELEQIRRERNRMHAKRTRDRKKLHLEATEDMISRLEQENRKLRASMKASVGGSSGSAGGGSSSGLNCAGTTAKVKSSVLPGTAHVPGFPPQRAPQQSTLPPPSQHDQQQQPQQQSVPSPHVGTGQAQYAHPPPHLVQQFANHAFLHPGAAPHLQPPHLHGHVYPAHQQFMHPGHPHPQQVGFYPPSHAFERSADVSGSGGEGKGGSPGVIKQEGNPYLQQAGAHIALAHSNHPYLLHYQGWPAAAYGPPPAALAGKLPHDPQQHGYLMPESMASVYKSWNAAAQVGAGATSSPFVPWADASFMPAEVARLDQQQHLHHHHHTPASPTTSSSGRQAKQGCFKAPPSNSCGGGSGSGSGGKRGSHNDSESATTDTSSRLSPSASAAEEVVRARARAEVHHKRAAADREQAIEENQHRLDQGLSRGCHEAWQKTRRERSAKRKRSGGRDSSGKNRRRIHRSVDRERVGSGASGEGSEYSSGSSSWMESSDSSSLMPGSTTSGEMGSRGRSSGSDSSIRRSGSLSSSSSGGEDSSRSPGPKQGRGGGGGGNGGSADKDSAADSLERRCFSAELP
ncbi:unnamed protein product [Pylaiella littoralis]